MLTDAITKLSDPSSNTVHEPAQSNFGLAGVSVPTVSASITYYEPGVNSILLEVRDNHGLKGSASTTIEIMGSASLKEIMGSASLK